MVMFCMTGGKGMVEQCPHGIEAKHSGPGSPGINQPVFPEAMQAPTHEVVHEVI